MPPPLPPHPARPGWRDHRIVHNKGIGHRDELALSLTTAVGLQQPYAAVRIGLSQSFRGCGVMQGPFSAIVEVVVVLCPALERPRLGLNVTPPNRAEPTLF